MKDLSSDRMVAYAQPISSATDQEKEQFLREARLTARLQHPNIMSIYDQGLDQQGIPFFTMEFMQGENLREIIEKRDTDGDSSEIEFPLFRLLEIFVKICDALSYAHSLGVVHLDVKPANITVGLFGEVLLCDWGLARILQMDLTGDLTSRIIEERPDIDLLNDLNLERNTKGAPGFMAPEQIDPSFGEEVSVRSDVYALGAVLYVILTRRPPVTGASAHERLEKTRQGQIMSPRELLPFRHIPEALEAVAMKALALNPADRYSSVALIRDEIDRYLNGFPTLAQHASPFDHFRLLIKRRPIVFKVVEVALVLFFLGSSFALIKVGAEKRKAVDARAIAESLRDESVRARYHAEESLRLYEEETLRRQRISRSVQYASQGLVSGSNFMRAGVKENILKMQLKEEPGLEEKSEIILQLAMLNFVQQNFQEARYYFSQIELEPNDRDLGEIARYYAGKKESDDVWLEPSDLRDIILQIPSWRDYVCYALVFYYFRDEAGIKQQDPRMLLPLVETVLDRLNHRGESLERTDELHLDKTEDGWHLSLSGKPYSIFNLPLPEGKSWTSVLNVLQLYSLDISYGRVRDPAELQGIKIKELDITGMTSWAESQAKHLKWITTLKTVRHSLNVSDAFLRKSNPDIEFIRVSPDEG